MKNKQRGISIVKLIIIIAILVSFVLFLTRGEKTISNQMIRGELANLSATTVTTDNFTKDTKIVIGPESNNTLTVGGGNAVLSLYTEDGEIIACDSNDITWTSSDTSVLKVQNETEEGVITAIKPGEATVTVTLNVRDEFTLKSNFDVTVLGILMDKDNPTTLEKGKTVTMKATTVPAGEEITWESSNSNVAKIDSKTGKLTGISAGKATITAKATINGEEFTESEEIEVISVKEETIKNGDNTTASGLPYAGMKNYMFGLIVTVAIIGMVSYHLYRKYNI